LIIYKIYINKYIYTINFIYMNKIKMDFIPTELLAIIFSNVDYYDIDNVLLVNKSWYNIIKDNVIFWKELAYKYIYRNHKIDKLSITQIKKILDELYPTKRNMKYDEYGYAFKLWDALRQNYSDQRLIELFIPNDDYYTKFTYIKSKSSEVVDLIQPLLSYGREVFCRILLGRSFYDLYIEDENRIERGKGPAYDFRSYAGDFLINMKIMDKRLERVMINYYLEYLTDDTDSNMRYFFYIYKDKLDNASLSSFYGYKDDVNIDVLLHSENDKDVIEYIIGYALREPERISYDVIKKFLTYDNRKYYYFVGELLNPLHPYIISLLIFDGIVLFSDSYNIDNVKTWYVLSHLKNMGYKFPIIDKRINEINHLIYYILINDYKF
ncbi:F-box domain-containing protein, partial [Orpheovirus IHUMI-LCC2]